MKAKVLISLFFIVGSSSVISVLNGCIKCQEAQNYRVVNAIVEARKIIERVNFGFLSQRVDFGEEVKWDSLVILVYPELQLAQAEKINNVGSFINTAYACDPVNALPTQQIEDINIIASESIEFSGVTIQAGQSLNNFFTVFDFNSGESFFLTDYLTLLNKPFLADGVFFSMSQSHQNQPTLNFTVSILTNDGREFISQTTTLILKPVN